MISLLVALFFGACYAQTVDEVGDKIQRILTGAAQACSNNVIQGGLIDNILCGGLVPQGILDFVSDKFGVELNFGPSSVWCASLACAYRAMGCADATYRTENQILTATGNVESCGSKIGLDEAKCSALAKFVAMAPNASPNKRSVEEELQDNKAAARIVLRHYMPEVYAKIDFASIGEPSDAEAFSHRKRDGLVDLIQVCSPIIAATLQQLQATLSDKIVLPFNFTSIVGPCGAACTAGLCGLNILCQTQAAPLISYVNQMRNQQQCNPAFCANFEQAPANNVCKDVQCNMAAGQFEPGYLDATGQCPPPKKITRATRLTVDSCCETCFDNCNGVQCSATLDQCSSTQQWPQCTDPVLDYRTSMDCCKQCLDPCFLFNEQDKAAVANGQPSKCQPVPSSCPPGQVLGPGFPGDCCKSCVAPCSGVSCAGAPKSQADCPGKCDEFVPRPSTPSACPECCNRCVPKDCVNAQLGAATTTGLTVAASLVAALAMAF